MRNSILYLFILITVPALLHSQENVGIGTQHPDESAVLDVYSTDKGMLLPRMGSMERMAIPNPATGLLVYDDDQNTLYQYNGTNWERVGSKWSEANNKIYYNEGNVGIGTDDPTSPLTIFGHSTGALEIKHSGGSVASLRAWNTGSTTFFGTSSNHPLNIITTGSTRIHIDNAGRIGMGINSGLTERLHLNGAIVLGENNNDIPGIIRFADDKFEGYDGQEWKDLGAAAGGKWQESGDDIYYNEGNVAIGTDSALAQLHVEGLGDGQGSVVFVGEFKENSSPIPVEGIGTRLLWHPDKAAFRVGRISDEGTGFEIMWNNEFIGNNSMAWGNNTRASSLGSTAWGFQSQAIGEWATAFGWSNSVSGDFSTSWGNLNSVTGDNATAWGNFNSVIGNGATAWGFDNNSNSTYTTTWGGNNIASNSYATAWGTSNTSSGQRSTSWGASNTSSGLRSTTWGINNTSSEQNTTSWGENNTSGGMNSTAWGLWNLASGQNSTVWGQENNASQLNATAWGVDNNASGPRSTTWGLANLASHPDATAWGLGNYATGSNATAWGNNNTASEGNATAWGFGNEASGQGSTAWGQENTASQLNSTAWGLGNEASGQRSTAWGRDNIASDFNATAWGWENEASGQRSTAWGNNNIASGLNSTALGSFNLAKSLDEVVIGRYNTDYTPASTTGWNSSDRLFVIGNGSSNQRRDALIMYKSGRIENFGSTGHKTVEILNSEANQSQGVINLFNSDGGRTIKIDGQAASGSHAHISLWDGVSADPTIQINSDWGGSGRSRIVTDVLQINGGSDLSENFNIESEDLQPIPGMVVSISEEKIGSLEIARAAFDKKVAGIISGANGVDTGMLMGQKGSLADGDFPVALTGRVYVYANNEAGEIVPGDMLTTSYQPGYAMKVTDHSRAQGAIIGKAMSKIDENGFVLVLVNLQ
jgi:hypothetical protein